MACDWTTGMVKVDGCLNASVKREGRETRLTACAGEGERSVRSIGTGTMGICVRVCAPSGGHAFNSSMLRDDSF